MHRPVARFAATVTALLAIGVLLGGLGGCSREEGRVIGGRAPDLSIVSGSENESLEPIIQEFARKKGVRITVTYKGSVDMMLEMGDPEFPYDAVWPANSLWIDLGDTQRRVKHQRSIMSSPVVFGVRRSTAERLALTEGDVRIADLLQLIRDGEFSFMMTSATQSNSGASAYMGFLYALAGKQRGLELDDLETEQMREDIRDLLGGINRSSGSSGWLKTLFVESDYDAMVNYESMMIEANQEIIRRGGEPLFVIYPVDGIVIADSPLGYVDRGDDAKEQLFLELQEYLLAEEVQNQLGRFGRRTSSGAIAGTTDTAVFNPAWGIRGETTFSPISMPRPEVLREALRLYQSEFRKPSFTIFALDFSGSMDGPGEEQLKAAMELLLDQDQAQTYLLQTGQDDVIVVLPFAGDVFGRATHRGNDPRTLRALYEEIERLQPDGGTNIYAPVIHGLEIMAQEPDLDAYIPAIILMTDGEHTADSTFDDMARAWQRVDLDVPVFAIMFGNALEGELKEITTLTRARLFDGREDLVHAFRSVRGYN